MPPLLARNHMIEDGGWLTISSPRGEIEARAKVTDRIKPLKVDGRTLHQVAMPFHWGWGGGGGTGDAVNDLITLSGDPNVAIQESKAFTCDVRAGGGSRSTKKLARKPPGDPVRADDDHFAEERPQA